MTDNARLRASEDVIAREVGGEMVLLDLVSGVYFGLDPVGSRVWTRLTEDAANLVELADLIEAEFDAPRERIEDDLKVLLDQFAEKNLTIAA